MKSTHPVLILAFALMCTLWGCQPPASAPPIDMDALNAEITAMEDAYAAGMAAKDVDAIVAYYADDAQNLGNKEPTTVGKEAIRANLVKDMATDSSTNVTTFAVTDIWASGDLAVETGTSKTVDKDGNVVNTGKYMSLFEKRDGKYLCIRDIWNSDTDDDDDDDDGGEDDDD